MSLLSTPIEYLKGMWPQRAALLKQELNLGTYGDLLEYFPYRYFDRTRLTPIAEVEAGQQNVQIGGTLVHLFTEGEMRKKRLTATLFDETGKIDLVWFGPAANYLQKQLIEGSRYIAFGKVNVFNGLLSINQPEMELWKTEQIASGMQPVYSSTQKLIAKGITNRSFSKITAALFEQLREVVLPETFPAKLREAYHLCTRMEALWWIHFPANDEQLEAAKHRLKFEELLMMQLTVAQLRLKNHQQAGYHFPRVGTAFHEFYEHQLPFQLTGAQKRVLHEIRKDTGTGRQMNRLLQGDVGSGKTIVALMAMLLAYDNGFQACLMAPTEILARQHYQSLSSLLEPMHIPVALLTGTVKGKERKSILQGLEAGDIPFIVGTHALIEDPVIFKNLGLAVIDEQHRFGVHQRAKLWKKNARPPHVLVMTATPIPRTLAMTLYGDLDISIIDELPPGRKEIKTLHRTDTHRSRVMQFVRSEIDKGRQAYVVYPLIEESEKLDFESLTEGYGQVKSWFPEHRYHIAMVHGKMEPAMKQRNMDRFVQGDAHIMVATTVIEVGVNVPNASVMVVESAERFGLSQLHQLRGRVGRGADQSYCILLTGKDKGEESRQRMNIMTETSNGFVIAEQDLLLRGPGEMHGTRQSGALKFKLADIVADGPLVEQTRDLARQLSESDPELQDPEHWGIREILKETSSKSVWGKIG